MIETLIKIPYYYPTFFFIACLFVIPMEISASPSIPGDGSIGLAIFEELMVSGIVYKLFKVHTPAEVIVLSLLWSMTRAMDGVAACAFVAVFRTTVGMIWIKEGPVSAACWVTGFFILMLLIAGYVHAFIPELIERCTGRS